MIQAVLLFLFLFQSHAAGVTSERKLEIATARFDAGRFKAIDADLTIYFFISNTVEVKGLGSQSWDYSIHETKNTNSEFSPSIACDNVGDKLSEGVLAESSTLQQAKNIIGKLLVIRKPGETKDDSKMCATILKRNDAKYIKTKFTDVVHGTVEFMQDSADGDTTVSINLKYQDDAGKSTTTHQLKIVENCESSGADFISVSTENLPCRKVIMKKANELNITRGLQDNSLWISVSDDSVELDCVPLAKKAIARFDSIGVNGHIKFVPSLSSDDFNLEIDLKGLNERAKWFHVHFLPVSMVNVSDSLNSVNCGSDYVKGHYFYINEEEREIWPGELNDDYEFDFTDQIDVKKILESRQIHVLNENVIWTGRRLSGPYSMIGRSIVIHKKSGGRLMCATILEEGARYEKAQQKFTGEIEGTIEVMWNKKRNAHRDNVPPDGTEVTMFINLAQKNGGNSGRDEYKWCADDTFPCESMPCRKVVTLMEDASSVRKVESGTRKIIRGALKIIKATESCDPPSTTITLSNPQGPKKTSYDPFKHETIWEAFGDTGVTIVVIVAAVMLVVIGVLLAMTLWAYKKQKLEHLLQAQQHAMTQHASHPSHPDAPDTSVTIPVPATSYQQPVHNPPLALNQQQQQAPPGYSSQSKSMNFPSSTLTYCETSGQLLLPPEETTNKFQLKDEDKMVMLMARYDVTGRRKQKCITKIYESDDKSEFHDLSKIIEEEPTPRPKRRMSADMVLTSQSSLALPLPLPSSPNVWEAEDVGLYKLAHKIAQENKPKFTEQKKQEKEQVNQVTKLHKSERLDASSSDAAASASQTSHSASTSATSSVFSGSTSMSSSAKSWGGAAGASSSSSSSNQSQDSRGSLTKSLTPLRINSSFGASRDDDRDNRRSRVLAAADLYSLDLGEVPLSPDTSDIRERTFAHSNFKFMYSKARMPEDCSEFLLSVKKLIEAHARFAKISNDDQKRFYKTLYAEAWTQPKVLQGDVAAAAEYLWSSAHKLKNTEFCGILNQAIRRDERDEMIHAAMFVRALNAHRTAARANYANPTGLKLLSKREKFPSEARVWRGGGFDNQFKSFFTVGLKYRVPGFLASSFSQNVCKFFMNRVPAGLWRVIWQIKMDKRGIKEVQYRPKQASLVKKTHLKGEAEYLFVPYSVFTIQEVKWSDDPCDPHQITILSAFDNRMESEDLPLAPWY